MLLILGLYLVSDEPLFELFQFDVSNMENAVLKFAEVAIVRAPIVFYD
jgi:hypothetical protein